jgi:hypothetical protein
MMQKLEKYDLDSLARSILLTNFSCHRNTSVHQYNNYSNLFTHLIMHLPQAKCYYYHMLAGKNFASSVDSVQTFKDSLFPCNKRTHVPLSTGVES